VRSVATSTHDEGADMRRSRNAFLIAVVAAGATAAVGAPTALAVSDSVLAGSAGAITFHPFTIPPNTGCVRWAEDGTYNCDPVNVIFPGRSPGQVRDLLRARGWTTFDLGSSQALHFAAAARYSQDVQVFRADGRNSAGQSLRYHVRLWRVRGVVSTVTVGAVHHEARSGFSDTIDRSWDASQAFMAGQLCGASCSTTGPLPKQQQMQGGDNEWRGWANDASATVIP
jgi:hypothetical protein